MRSMDWESDGRSGLAGSFECERWVCLGGSCAVIAASWISLVVSIMDMDVNLMGIAFFPSIMMGLLEWLVRVID